MLVLLRPQSTLSAPELPRSNQVFGAIAWGMRAVGGAALLDDLLALCDSGDPPLLLSSGFPWVDAGAGPIAFLPRPAAFELPEPIRAVSLGLFRRFTAASAETAFRPDIAVAGDKAALADELATPAVRRRAADCPRATVVRRRSTIGSRPGEGTVHARTELSFPAGTGWCFFVRVRRPEWDGRLRAAIRWVCDTGWGGDRSIGKGVAAVEFADDPAGFSLEPSGRMLLLSSCHPGAAELGGLAEPAAGTAIELEYREGAANQGRPLLTIREGSVLPVPAGGRPAGSCPTVSADGAAVGVRWFGFACGAALGAVR